MKKEKMKSNQFPTIWESLKKYLLEIFIASILIYFLYWLTLLYVENS